MQPSAVVLCGGTSRRMGRDKASLPFGAETLLERVVRIVGGEFPEVVLAARRGQSLPAGFLVVHDELEDGGPLAALATALERVRSDLTVVVACDMPLLQPAVLRRLLGLAGAADACVPVAGDRVMTTCAVLRTAPASAEASRLLASGERSLRALIARLNPRIVHPDELRDVDPDLLSFVACNTPEEYRHALGLAGLPVNGAHGPAV